MQKGPGKTVFKVKLANFFGSFGYLFALLNWMWIGGLILYPVIAKGALNWVLPEPAPATKTTPSLITAPDPIAVTVGAIVVIICVGLAIYSLYALPRTVGKTGSAVTQGASKKITPMMIKQKKVSKKTYKKISFTVMNYLKLILVLLPVAALPFASAPSALTPNIVMITTVFLAIVAFINFAIQLFMTFAFKLKLEYIW